jgi:hypothetical protein
MYQLKGVLRYMSTVLPISAKKTGHLAGLLDDLQCVDADVQLLSDHIGDVVALIEGLRGNGAVPASATPLPQNWIEELLASEQARFGSQFDLSPARNIIAQYTSEQVARWQAMKQQVCILPQMVLTPETNLARWDTKPNDWYWEQLAAGNLFVPDDKGELTKLTECRFGGIVALVDTRKKPDYKDGLQMFAKDRDFLGNILAKLRKEAKIRAYKAERPGSRFGVSPDEIDARILGELAKLLGLEANQVRLETAIEMNLLPQLYTEMARAKDGTTNTWVWLHERFESAADRLGGGHSGYGGLAGVGWGDASDGSGRLAFRPLGVLGTWTLGS